MKISILGAGESGVGAALLAKKLQHQVFVSEGHTIPKKFRMELIENQIEFEAQAHSFDIILDSDIIVKSPGIPDDAEVVNICRRNNIPIISEIEYASRFTNAKIIGITGSNGKTTTTLLCHHILNTAGLSVGVGGNVGESFARLLTKASKDIYVLELSSFQLDGSPTLKPFIAILLNITADHLDRYNYKMSNYIASKFLITANQDQEDYFIFNSKDENISRTISEMNIAAQQIGTPDKLLKDGILVLDEKIKINLDKCSLRGPHNHLNIFCALKTAQLLGVKKEDMQKAIDSFSNAPHRMEWVTTHEEVEFINDSKATNVDAAYYALQSMDKPIVWIAGGTDKGNDYSQLASLAKQKVKALICLGADNSKIESYFKPLLPIIESCDSMSEAVKLAIKHARAGDCILLSPACSSFDLFKNFMDRGDQFKEIIKRKIN